MVVDVVGCLFPTCWPSVAFRPSFVEWFSSHRGVSARKTLGYLVKSEPIQIDRIH